MASAEVHAPTAAASAETTTAGLSALPLPPNSQPQTQNPQSEQLLDRETKQPQSQPQQQLEQQDLEYPQYGEKVLLYGSSEMVQEVLLEKRGESGNRLGLFFHDDIVRCPFGFKVFDHRRQKWLVVMKSAADLDALAQARSTQILYHADVALAVMLLEASPGKRIGEAGTGSACLTAYLAEAVYPTGSVFTYEFNRVRHEKARAAAASRRWSDCVHFFYRDICTDGFSGPGGNAASALASPTAKTLPFFASASAAAPELEVAKEKPLSSSSAAAVTKENVSAFTGESRKEAGFSNSKTGHVVCSRRSSTSKHKEASDEIDASAAAFAHEPAPKSLDAIFLDIPAPWLALDHASAALKSGGRLVMFSPCIEQVQKTCAGLYRRDFRLVHTFEVYRKPWGVYTTKPVIHISEQQPSSTSADTLGDSAAAAAACEVSPKRRKRGSIDRATASAAAVDTPKPPQGQQVEASEQQQQQQQNWSENCFQWNNQQQQQEIQKSQEGSQPQEASSRLLQQQQQQRQRARVDVKGRSGGQAIIEKKGTKSSDAASSAQTAAAASFPLLISHLLGQTVPLKAYTCGFPGLGVVGAHDAQQPEQQEQQKAEQQQRAAKDQHEQKAATCGEKASSQVPAENKRVREIFSKGYAKCWVENLSRGTHTLEFDFMHYPLRARGHTGYLTVAVQR